LADVDTGRTAPVRIVFGGEHRLFGGELVPVAPIGSRIHELRGMRHRWKKMRARRYREEWSHGMLCSLDELGWIPYGPNKVAVLRDLTPGQHLDELTADHRPEVVVGWHQAEAVQRERLNRATVLYDLPASRRLERSPEPGSLPSAAILASPMTAGRRYDWA
jgi:hypothetical protein